MPHKHNADRRHHIPKMAFKVQNWQARYTDAAIQISPMLRTAFKLALRQTEGLMTSCSR